MEMTGQLQAPTALPLGKIPRHPMDMKLGYLYIEFCKRFPLTETVSERKHLLRCKTAHYKVNVALMVGKIKVLWSD